jgi:preprotein translocase subunit SecF
MLIGVITGIYSSVFVAAPILLDLGNRKTQTKNQTADSMQSENIKQVTSSPTSALK